MQPSEEIKERINIVDLIGEYVQLKKAGANFRAICPFHQEKTPSFMVSPSKQIWHCFGCGLGGDIFEFVKQIEAVEFPEALHILASRAGVTLRRPTVEYQQDADQKKTLLAINDWAAKYYALVLKESQSAAEARDYVQKRGFKPETIRDWQIGYAPGEFHSFENFIVKKGFQKKEAVLAGLLVEKDTPASPAPSQGGDFFDRFRARIMFPLLDLHGRVVGFTGRLLKEQEGMGKYVNSPETPIYSKSHLIYGLNFAKLEIRKLDQVIVVEGNVDVITCHEAGFKNVVGSSGTALTEAQLLALQRFTNNISFAFDVDAAGLAATRRAVELALSLGFDVKIVAIPKALAKDPDELIRRDPKLWERQVAEAKNFLDFYFEAVFANLNVESSTDKKRAVAELLPLLALLPDAIDRSHYMQKLAFKLGVDQKIILDLLNKAAAARRTAGVSGAQALRPVPRKPKQELLERRTLGFILKHANDLEPSEWENLALEDFTVPLLQEIFSEVKNEIQSGAFALNNFVIAQPKWRAEIDLLIFALENELAFTPDWNVGDLKRQFFADLKQATTKRKMQQLAAQIKAAEVSGRLEEVKLLSSEFNNLTRELAKYAT